MPEHITLDGHGYEVLHRFREERVLIRYDGAVVFADCNASVWELSGVPAREDEKAIFRKFVPDETTTTFVKGGG